MAIKDIKVGKLYVHKELCKVVCVSKIESVNRHKLVVWYETLERPNIDMWLVFSVARKKFAEIS